jgi:hypothetical protein
LEPAVPRVRRQVEQWNVRREFSLDNPSYHPVEGIGRNGHVPSLLPPLTESSRISCTDCHSNDDLAGAGGEAPAGPHGSRYEPILARRYEVLGPVEESPEAYALCYGCHRREVLLSEASSFPEHRRHVVEARAPCAACHDPHGIWVEQGSEEANAHLINFDVRVVQPLPEGTLTYRSRGAESGACWLRCHGVEHRGSAYGAAAAPGRLQPPGF